MTTNGTQLDTWLTKPEAAAALGISERTLDRLIAEGKGPEKRQRPRAGVPPEPVFNPHDVEALAAARNPPAVFAPDSAVTVRPAPQQLQHAGIPPQLAGALAIVEHLAQIAQRPRLEASSAPAKLWLTIAEAKEYTGLSGGFLRRAIREGSLPAITDRVVKVRRVDLESFAPHSETLAQMAESTGGAR